MKLETYNEKLKKEMDKKKGFTIIELVITIFILSFGVIGVFSAFSIITILTSDSADRLTATYLAQEGMEIIRNIRDKNWLDMDATPCTDKPCAINWLSNKLDGCLSGCGVDYKSTGAGTASAGTYLNNDSNGFYSYLPGEQTKFKRKITIEPILDTAIIPPDENAKDDHIVKVTAEVSWDKKATVLNPSYLRAGVCDPENCIKVEWMLYDWYNYRYQ